MEGHSLTRGVKKLLQESDSGTFLDSRFTYDLLYGAICDFNYKTHFLTSSQSISVVAGTTAYNLNPDYGSLRDMSDENQYFIKYVTGGATYFLYPLDRSDAVLANNTTQVAVPSGFYIADATAIANITGSATVTGSVVNGETTLTDSGAPFTNVVAGDFVHNTTDGSHGRVVSVTSTSAIVCALFDGTNNYFTATTDAYVIVPQTRYQLILDPPPSQTATITLHYVQVPTPVYSPYRKYRLPDVYSDAIIKYAAYLYKYRDKEPNFGDAFYKTYQMHLARAISEMRRSLPQRNSFKVNLHKINPRSRPRGQWGGGL